MTRPWGRGPPVLPALPAAGEKSRSARRPLRHNRGMIGRRITYRIADGVRIPGTWRHAFIRNGGYFLTDLFIYADGLIDCWGLVTIEEFEEKLRTGWVATTLPDGAEASAHELAGWKFSEPQSWLTPALLIAEVRDTIDQLNKRPDSTGRALAAVDVFLADRTEENRAAAEAAFLAVPASQRRYALGDMDSKDWPLRVLVAGPGGRTYLPGDPPVSQEDHDRALAYFEERAHWKREYDTRVPADGPATPHPPRDPALPVVSEQAGGRPRPPRTAQRLPRPHHRRGSPPPLRRPRLLGPVGRAAGDQQRDHRGGHRSHGTRARGRGTPP